MSLTLIETIILGISVLLPIICMKNFIVKNRHNIYPFPQQVSKLNILKSVVWGFVFPVLILIVVRFILMSHTLVTVTSTLSGLVLYVIYKITGLQLGHMQNNHIYLKSSIFGLSIQNDIYYFFNIPNYPHQHIKCKYIENRNKYPNNNNKYFVLDGSGLYRTNQNDKRYMIFEILEVIQDHKILRI